MSRIALTGLKPEPLASYLSALAVLRLVAEQSDRAARVCWDRGHFVLDSALDEEGLNGFFLERYAPSPLLAPWGARSGFYAGGSETSARDALETLEHGRIARGREMSSPQFWGRERTMAVTGSRPTTSRRWSNSVSRARASLRVRSRFSGTSSSETSAAS